jgi:hypothetical protein
MSIQDDGNQLVQMDCRINTNEEMPEGDMPMNNGEILPPFDPLLLINQFTIDPVIDILINLGIPGVIVRPVVNPAEFTVVTELVTGVLPGPFLQRTTTILIKNFGSFTSPFSTVVNGNIQYGVDLTSVNAIVSRLLRCLWYIYIS